MTQEEMSYIIRRANVEGLKGNKVLYVIPPTDATQSDYVFVTEPYMPETPDDMLF